MTIETPVSDGGDRAIARRADQSAKPRRWPPLRWAAPAVILLGIAPLAAAYIAEYGFGLEPCILCLYQRLPFAVLVGLGLLGLFFRKRDLATRGLLGLTATVLTAGAALAGYHVGVEQGWWPGPAMCGSTSIDYSSFEAYRASVLNSGIVRCDEIAFSLFGISMAGYNFLLSVFAAIAAALWAARTTSDKEASDVETA